jgi:hypothetical protein
MPQYDFFVWNKRSRVKYPRSYLLPDIDAAHAVAARIARVFGEVIPLWNDLAYDRQNNFAVEVVDETGQTVLTVPFKDAEPIWGSKRLCHQQSAHAAEPSSCIFVRNGLPFGHLVSRSLPSVDKIGQKADWEGYAPLDGADKAVLIELQEPDDQVAWPIDVVFDIERVTRRRLFIFACGGNVERDDLIVAGETETGSAKGRDVHFFAFREVSSICWWMGLLLMMSDWPVPQRIMAKRSPAINFAQLPAFE